MVPEELLGPGALLVAALVAVGVLWREHIRRDADLVEDRNFWRDVALQSIPTAREALNLGTTLVRRKGNG